MLMERKKIANILMDTKLLLPWPAFEETRGFECSVQSRCRGVASMFSQLQHERTERTLVSLPSCDVNAFVRSLSMHELTNQELK